MKFKDEIQLETLLEFVRDNAELVIVPMSIWSQLAVKPLSCNMEIEEEEHSLFNLLQTVVISLIHRFLHVPTEEVKLRGMVILYLQYLDPIYRKVSVARALAAFQDPTVVDDIFDLVQGHSREFGVPPGMDREEIAERLTRLAAIHKRTAERHVQPARELLLKILGAHLQELCDLIRSVSISSVPIKADELAPDVSALIKQYTIRKCSLAPVAYDVNLPISECVSRSMHVHGERFSIESPHLANHLVGCSGTISGLPGSGRSTLLRFVAFQGNQNNINLCHFLYFSAREYLDFAKQGYICWQYIALQLCESSQLDQEHCPSVATQLEELNRELRLVLLIDDIEHLDDTSRPLVISKLASATSIFFSVTPWMVDVIRDELVRRNCDRNLINLQLDGLDLASREAIAKLVAHQNGTEYVDGSISRFFDDWNAEEGAIALGVMAAAHARGTEPTSRHLQFGYALFCEFLQRDGFSQVCLLRQTDSLDPTMARIVQVGRIAREQIMVREPSDLLRTDAESRMTMSLDLERLQELWDGPGDDVLQLRIFRRLRYVPAIHVIFPSVEELLMTLDCYYYGGCSKSYLDILLPGSRGPVIQRVRKSVDLVSVLFDCVSDVRLFQGVSHA